MEFKNQGVYLRKKIFAFFTFLFLVIGLCHIYDRAKEGFSIKKIQTVLPLSLTSEKRPNSKVLKALGQPFYYLGRGGQVFAFESEDKKYVLKLIRYDRLTPSFSMKFKKHLFGSFPCFEKELKEKIYREKSTLNSYNLAALDLSDLTEVMYTHLKQTSSINKIVPIYDKLGRQYFLDLDSTGFVLQKKADLLGDILTKEKDKSKIKEILCQYLTLIKNRSEKGIWIKDHNFFLRNYGFIGKKLCEIDVGSYRKTDVSNRKLLTQNNIDHIQRAKNWIKEKMPEQVDFFEAKANEILMGEQL